MNNNTSIAYACLFSDVASMLSSSGGHSHELRPTANFVCACTAVVIFGHLNRSFYLLIYVNSPTGTKMAAVARPEFAQVVVSRV